MTRTVWICIHWQGEDDGLSPVHKKMINRIIREYRKGSKKTKPKNRKKTSTRNKSKKKR